MTFEKGRVAQRIRRPKAADSPLHLAENYSWKILYFS